MIDIAPFLQSFLLQGGHVLDILTVGNLARGVLVRLGGNGSVGLGLGCILSLLQVLTLLDLLSVTLLLLLLAVGVADICRRC